MLGKLGVVERTINDNPNARCVGFLDWGSKKQFVALIELPKSRDRVDPLGQRFFSYSPA